MKSHAKFTVALITLAVMGTVVTIVIEDRQSRWASENKDAVGGVETYNEQRLAHLLRLRKNVHVSDPVVKAREIAEIDAQIAEIGNEQIEETGDNLRIERVIK